MILLRVNDLLEEKGTRFLTGDTMCCFDCELMPKLQHVRVAGAFFCDYEIPAELGALWKYIKEMYQLDAFTQSNPADQDIINIYKQQQGSGPRSVRSWSPPRTPPRSHPPWLPSVTHCVDTTM